MGVERRKKVVESEVLEKHIFLPLMLLGKSDGKYTSISSFYHTFGDGVENTT